MLMDHVDGRGKSQNYFMIERFGVQYEEFS